MKTKSRAERYDEAKEHISQGLSTIEELKDELQEWLDNMPENLQGGSKEDELQEAIDALDDVISNVGDAIEEDVEFPRMR